jgi:hypothetical protein
MSPIGPWRNMIIVTSWDDGHPADLKMAELLNHYGIAGTFFVPARNIEGYPVMSKSELRSIGADHEIGSHTYSHRRLDSVSDEIANEEIVAGKSFLEDTLGHEVGGFCYPGGRITKHAIDCLRRSKTRYARSIESFRLDIGKDLYRVPTTIQVSPHKKSVYIRNFVKRGNVGKRFHCFARAMTCTSVWQTLESIATESASRSDVFHFWGHSWEIETLGLWGRLEQFLSFLQGLEPVCMTAAQCVEAHVEKSA